MDTPDHGLVENKVPQTARPSWGIRAFLLLGNRIHAPTFRDNNEFFVDAVAADDGDDDHDDDEEYD